MALPVRRGYKGAPVTTTLSSPISDSATSATVGSVTGWATVFPYYAVLSPGTSKEEKVRVTGISGTTLTIVRAQDDTTASNHDAAATIYPVLTAIDADEANLVASAMTTKGDLISSDGSTVTRLGVGTNTHVLQADSTQSSGIKWGQVATAGIADGAVTSAKIADGTIVTGDLADGAVTSAKIADGTIVAGDLASSLMKLLCPVGTISAYGGAAAPTGWLQCDGSSINVAYTELRTLVGTTTPDLRGRVAMGKTDTGTGTGEMLLGAGGNRKIGSNHLPTHTHSLDHNHAAFDWTHDHGVFTITGGTHGHTYSNADNTPYNVINLADAAGLLVSGYTSTSVGGDGSHSHSVDVPSHTGSIDVPNFTGSVTTTFANDDYFQPFIAVNYIIKHDY